MRALSMKWIRKTMVSVCCVLIFGTTMAQVHPVQVLAQSIPPTPVHFSDFANAWALNGPLRVQIVPTDLNLSNRQVRLQVSFKGNGINFRSSEVVAGAAPLFLQGGLPTVLGQTELAPYFEFGNLVGIPPQVYGSTIPDGTYQVCFEVFDVLTGKRLSNTGCAFIAVFQNSPPLLVLPENGSDVVERGLQNIVFQWTPRHTNVSQVEYDLSLVEIWDHGMDPQAAFLASVPLFTTTTSATTYVYGPTDPMLLPNKRYAWRVRARAKQGAEDIGMFQNQGHSQIFSFNHTEGCYVPHGIRHGIKGANQANIFWEDNSTDLPQFTVRYRAVGEGNEWFLNRTTANWTTLWDLRAGTAYEYQLKKTCSVTESDWAPIRQFTTHLETEEEDLYQCGVSPDVEITNHDPLPNLSVGESFTAGDFSVNIIEVQGSNGRFSGKGFITISYLANIKIAVGFDNIKINTDYQMVEGMVETSYDAEWSGVVDVDQAIEDIKMTLAQLVEMLSNMGIDGATRENIKKLTEMLVQQAQEELPQPIADKMLAATDKMNNAKEQYDSAMANADQETANQAKEDFKAAQKELNTAKKEQEDFLKAYASIIKDALKEIVKESNNNLGNGLDRYGEESIVVKETDGNLELTSSSLDQLSNVLQPEASTTSEQELTGHFEYERWKMLNHIATNLQTDEGTQELGNLMENEGKKLGVYIYDRLEEGAKKGDLVTEVKELIIQTITEKIALSTKLF